MSYFQKHLRNYEPGELRPAHPPSSQQGALKHKKMNFQRVKTEHNGPPSKTNHSRDGRSSRDGINSRDGRDENEASRQEYMPRQSQ